MRRRPFNDAGAAPLRREGTKPTLYPIAKAVISAISIIAVSESAKHGPALGVRIASQPLVSVLGIVWL